MASQGCAVTSLSILFKYYGIPGNDDPGKTLETLKENNCIKIDDAGCGYGGDNGFIRWDKIRNYLSKYNYMIIPPSDPDSSLDYLESHYFKKKVPVLAFCTNFNGHPFHYIILRGYEKGTIKENKVYISDPGWGNTYLKESNYDIFGCSPAYILKKK